MKFSSNSNKRFFFKLLQDAFKAEKVLASTPIVTPEGGHAAALFGMDDQNYLFKDSRPGKGIYKKFKFKLNLCNRKYRFQKRF